MKGTEQTQELTKGYLAVAPHAWGWSEDNEDEAVDKAKRFVPARVDEPYKVYVYDSTDDFDINPMGEVLATEIDRIGKRVVGE